MIVLRMHSFCFGLSFVLALAGVVEAAPAGGATNQAEVPLGAASKRAAAGVASKDAAGVASKDTAGVASKDTAGVESKDTAGVESKDAAGAASKAPPAAAPATAEQEDGSGGDRPLIQTLGEADQKIFLVDHDGTWSMHFENVITGNVVLLWRHAGGPEVTMKLPVDRPFTMSVHRLAPEVIVERLFEGYGYTMHYDDAGRLASVRVYSPREGFAYKTPRLTQSLSDWKKAETEPEAAAGPAQQP